jgi:hypothetical protein
VNAKLRTIEFQHHVELDFQLLEDPELLRQLCKLREERTDHDQVDLRPSGGMKGDLAVVIALAWKVPLAEVSGRGVEI